MNNLWTYPTAIVLASTSSTRRRLLEAVGVKIETCAPDVDERRLEQELAQSGLGADQIALSLAEAKARAVAARFPDRLVVAADQTLSCGDERFHKPGSVRDAVAQLKRLSGKTHQLHSGVSAFSKGERAFSYVRTASMTMRDLSDDFLESYVEAAGDPILGSVGAYQIEGLGLQLFEAIEGDYFTILGFPLLPFLEFLRSERAFRP